MLIRSKKAALESILALDHAFEGSYYNPRVTPEISLKNLQENIVQVYLAGPQNGVKRQHYLKNGLLLTTDGFILTSYHHFPDVEKDWKQEAPGILQSAGDYFLYRRQAVSKYHVRLKSGAVYPLDVTVCFSIPEFDIALVKAMINAKPEPVRFQVETREPEAQGKVAVLCPKGEQVKTGVKELEDLYLKARKKSDHHEHCNHEGVVMRVAGVNVEDKDHGKTVKGVFTLHSNFHHQHSGEPVVTTDGKLLGMVLGACTRQSEGQLTWELFSAKIKRMQKLVDLARDALKKEYLGWH